MFKLTKVLEVDKIYILVKLIQPVERIKLAVMVQRDKRLKPAELVQLVKIVKQDNG